MSNTRILKQFGNFRLGRFETVWTVGQLKIFGIILEQFWDFWVLGRGRGGTKTI